MQNQTFHKKETYFLLIWVLVGLMGLFIFSMFYKHAFPQAGLKLKVTAAQALNISKNFLKEQGINLNGYRSNVIFDVDNYSLIYLERAVGLVKTNELVNSKVFIWWWHCRWFKPLQKEEFEVDVDPSGKIRFFRHKIEEKSKGENLDKETAGKIAEDFLKKNKSLNLSEYRLIEDTLTKRPNRTDFYFVWEDKEFKVKDATYRHEVTILGDKVGRFNEHLKVPEEWIHNYEKYSAKGSLLSNIFWVFYVGLSIALLIVFLFKIRARQINWRFGIFAGIALAIVIIITNINSIPLYWSSYSTTSEISSFIFSIIIQSLIGGATAGLIILIMAPTSDSLSQEIWKGHLPLNKIFTKSGLVSKEFIKSSVVGYSLAFIFLAYIVIFYLLGQKIGVWVPPDIPYDNILSTYIPWIYALLIGLSASLNEELLFRLFSIPFLKKYLKFTWLAVIIPAIIWAFLHSTYPQRPFYIRGVELSIAGIVFGVIYIRYGILTTIITHYVINATLTSILFFQSSNLYFIISGFLVIGVILIPILPVLFSIITGKRKKIIEEYEKSEALQQPPLSSVNIDENIKTEGPTVLSQIIIAKYVPISKKSLRILILISILSICVFFIIPYNKLGDFINVEISKAKALQTANQYINSLKVPLKGFERKVISLSEELSGNKSRYVLEQLPVKETNEFFKKEFPCALWTVCWFKPLSKEEYYVNVDTKGNVYSYDHILEEDKEGEKLSQLQARKIAEEILTKNKNIKIDKYNLMNSSTEKRKNRNDHSFTWELKDFKIKEATSRMSIEVNGNEIVNYDKYLKLPEEWVREKSKTTLIETIQSSIITIIILGTVILCVVLFIIKFVKKDIKWKFSFTIAGILTSLFVVEKFNELPTIYLNYINTDSILNFYIQQGISFLITTSLMFLYISILVALSESLYREQFSEQRTLDNWFNEFRFSKLKSIEWFDAAMICLIIPVYAVCEHLFLWVKQIFIDSSIERSVDISTNFINTFSPAIHILTQGLYYAIGTIFLLALSISLLKKYIKRVDYILVLLTILFTVITCDTTKLNIFLWDFSRNIVGVLFIYLIIVKYIKHNLLAYFLLMFIDILIESSITLISYYSCLEYRLNGLIILLIVVIPFLYLTLLNKRLIFNLRE
ncbi:MAG: CPBP family intramembrane glutamic endopeptidase [Candidatus Firestonebacteria bacterium]